MMFLDQLQADLPPFDGVEELITPNQDVQDIIDEVIDAHSIYEPDYDHIARRFAGADLLERLFLFCQKNLKYVAEPRRRQTSRSPAAILAMSKVTGVDCKHYAGWIAGVIAAVSRMTGERFNAYYCFASYDPNDDEPGHVFVVVRDRDGETWIDPTPIINEATGRRTERFFDDRLMEPVYEPTYIKIPNMALSRIHGMRDTTGEERNIGTIYQVGEDACVGDAITDMSQMFMSSETGGGTQTVNVDSSGGGTDATMALNAVEPGLGTAVNQAISTLPDGDIKDFLNSFLKDPGKALMTLIKGRTYTIGDYSVAEMFMRNILGMSQIQRWEQVPDGYVPPAWAFFSAAMGVRIRTNTDLDALCGYNNTRQARAEAYLKRNPEETSDISMEAAVRAAYLFGEPGYDGLFSIWVNRNIKWPMSVFNPDPVNYPYVYPIPGPVQNTTFTGKHPVTGEQFVDGYPMSWTGIKYSNQLHTGPSIPGSGSVPTVPATGTTPPAGTTPGTSVPTPATQAGFSNIAGWLLLAGAVGVGIYGLSTPEKKTKSVTGMKGKKAGLLIVGGLLAAGAGYMLYRHYSISGKKQQLTDWANALPAATNVGKALLLQVIATMTDDELSALYDFVFDYASKGKVLTDAEDAPLRAQIIAISAKYGIFT